MRRQTAEGTKRDGRKAEYSDRPLTAEEREYAAKHHNLIFKYMRNMGLDQEEWYDILIIDYLQAVKKYFTYTELQQYDFPVILFRKLDAAYQSYFRALDTKKRKPESGICSLDFVIDNERGKERHVEAWMIDRKTSVERQVITKESFSEYLRNIEQSFYPEEMRTVLILCIDGYTKREIIKYCRDKFQGYDAETPWGSHDYDFIIRQLRTIFKETYGF